MTPEETDPDSAVSVQSLWERCGSMVACCSVGALSASVHAWDLKEVAIIFITSTIV